MFNLFKKKQSNHETAQSAGEDIAQHLAMIHSVHKDTGALIPAVEESPYIAGYLEGKIALFLKYKVESGVLEVKDIGMTRSMAIFLFLGEMGDAFLNASKRHSAERSPEFLAGLKNGATIAQYYIKTRDVSTNPEFQSALRKFRTGQAMWVRLEPDAKFETTDDRSAAILGLETMWFTEKL